MNTIFGIFHRDSRPVSPADLALMQAATPHAATSGELWLGDEVGLGLAGAYNPSHDTKDNPQKQITVSDNLVFTASGRIDNATDLGLQLGIPPAELHTLNDCQLMRLAYLTWGENCASHIYGDWTCVAWHPKEKHLFLARDHHGNTSLYYYSDQQVFAFAFSRQALLALNLAPVELDELYLAQVLISWFAYYGERTIHKPIKRLPPAHSLAVTPDQLQIRRYWRLEDTKELRLPSRLDYAEAFRDIFDDAVRSRLRSNGTIAATLSGGLDSGAVTATAANMLKASGKRISAYTSVPLSSTEQYVGRCFGDEFPLAATTANFAGNVDHHAVSATTISPIQAIRRKLEISSEPGHAAGNLFWLIDLERMVQAAGHKILLTGQMGNAGISWTGDLFSQGYLFWLQHLGLAGLKRAFLMRGKQTVKSLLPKSSLAVLRHLQTRTCPWTQNSAINPDFANRLRLLEQYLSEMDEQPERSPREMRQRILMPGRSILGALHAEMGAAHGLEVRDPSADARVLEFTFSVPDHIFIDPETGIDRWLIRETMKGRLPDEVRLNRRRGSQAGDLVPRMRACADEVELTLQELAAGPAAGYVDIPYMRQVWQLIRTEDTPEAFHKSVTVLTRGIMAGIFVNNFYK